MELIGLGLDSSEGLRAPRETKGNWVLEHGGLVKGHIPCEVSAEMRPLIVSRNPCFEQPQQVEVSAEAVTDWLAVRGCTYGLHYH